MTKRELNTGQNQAFTRYLHAITDLERISDHAMNLVENARKMQEDGISLSDQALSELEVMNDALSEVLDRTIRAFLHNDLQIAQTVDPLEEVIDDLCEGLKDRHVERMKNGDCTLGAGIALNDLIADCERISDHCSNIALATMTVESNSLRLHTNKYHAQNRHQKSFATLYERFSKQFPMPPVARKSVPAADSGNSSDSAAGSGDVVTVSAGEVETTEKSPA